MSHKVIGTPHNSLLNFPMADTLNLDSPSIQVFRQIKVANFEYTVFFRRHGIKWRMDFSIQDDTLAKAGDPTAYILGKIEEGIMRGAYKNATEAII